MVQEAPFGRELCVDCLINIEVWLKQQLVRDIHRCSGRMFSFAREPNCFVGHFLNLLPDYSKKFQLPLSMAASHQLAELMDSLEEWNREPNNSDCWIYIWGSGVFTSK
jgi:hypothetical protein